MRKYLVGALGAAIGALVIKIAYTNGRKSAFKELSEKLDFIAKVQEIKKDGES